MKKAIKKEPACKEFFGTKKATAKDTSKQEVEMIKGVKQIIKKNDGIIIMAIPHEKGYKVVGAILNQSKANVMDVVLETLEWGPRELIAYHLTNSK